MEKYRPENNQSDFRISGPKGRISHGHIINVDTASIITHCNKFPASLMQCNSKRSKVSFKIYRFYIVYGCQNMYGSYHYLHPNMVSLMADHQKTNENFDSVISTDPNILSYIRNEALAHPGGRGYLN